MKPSTPGEEDLRGGIGGLQFSTMNTLIRPHQAK